MESQQDFILVQNHHELSNEEEKIQSNESGEQNVETNEASKILMEVLEEERRLRIDSNRNSCLLPDKQKKTQCVFSIDQEANKFLLEGSDSIRMTFRDYISSKRETKGAEATLQQCGQFFTFIKVNATIQDIHTFKPYDLLLTVCEQTPTLFNNFFNLLRDSGYKSSTILVRVNALLNLIDWIRMTSNSHFTNLTEVRERLELERRFFTTIASRANKLKTKESLLESREWIDGGIIGAQRLMNDSRRYFDALVKLSAYQRLSSHQYSWCVGYTLASLWVFTLNARGQSVQKMTMKSWNEISTNQLTLSDKFKTANTYQYQIISSTDILKLYVDHIRKSAILPEHDSEEAALFLTYIGTPLSDGEASKKVERIFHRYGYHVTITKLRAMISTHIEDMYHENKLTIEGKLLITRFIHHMS